MTLLGTLSLVNADFVLTTSVPVQLLFYLKKKKVGKVGNVRMEYTTLAPSQGTACPGMGVWDVLEWEQLRACLTVEERLLGSFMD